MANAPVRRRQLITRDLVNNGWGMKISNFMQFFSRTTMTPGIRETLHTPRVRVFPEEKRITVTGHSRLEDPSIFYEEFMSLIEDCFNDFKTIATFDFKLNYLNTSSVQNGCSMC